MLHEVPLATCPRANKKLYDLEVGYAREKANDLLQSYYDLIGCTSKINATDCFPKIKATVGTF